MEPQEVEKKVEQEIKKRKIVAVAANVEIEAASPLVGNGYVLFIIQPTGGGVHVGPHKLYIFDHRPATIQAAKAIDSAASWEERSKVREALAEAVRQPAKVVVMEKRRSSTSISIRRITRSLRLCSRRLAIQKMECWIRG